MRPRVRPSCKTITLSRKAIMRMPSRDHHATSSRPRVRPSCSRVRPSCSYYPLARPCISIERGAEGRRGAASESAPCGCLARAQHSARPVRYLSLVASFAVLIVFFYCFKRPLFTVLIGLFYYFALSANCLLFFPPPLRRGSHNLTPSSPSPSPSPSHRLSEAGKE